jgi:hypothetical protein
MKKKILKVLKSLILALLIINIILIVLDFYHDYQDTLTKDEYIGFSEKYSKRLFYKIKDLKSLNKALEIRAKKRNVKKDELEYLNIASTLVKERFYYSGYSFYDAGENIILYLLGKYVWYDFAAIVIPDDILKKEHAACSQQSIVLMELFKMNGFSVRKVGLNHHFTLEAKFKGNWYFFDPTFEPNLNEKRTSLKKLYADKKKLIESYKHVMNTKQVLWRFEKINYGKVNEYPAKKMKLLHVFLIFYLKNVFLISITLMITLVLTIRI